MHFVSFFAGLFVAIASWFGHGAALPAASTGVVATSPAVSITASTSASIPGTAPSSPAAADDKQAIEATVRAVFVSYRQASTLTDIQSIVSRYYAASVQDDFQVLSQKLSSTPADLRSYLSYLNGFPDPDAISFTDVSINGDDATATADLPSGTQASGGMTVSYANVLVAALHKEAGQWKIETLSFESNGTAGK